MKKSTKIISAVLASLMLVAAGCGSDKPAEKKAGGPEEKVQLSLNLKKIQV